MLKKAVICLGLPFALLLASPTMGQATRSASGFELGRRYTFEEAFPILYPTLQADLGLNDADFAAIRPKILKVYLAQQAAGLIPTDYAPGPPRAAPQDSGFVRRGPAPTPWREIPNLPPVQYALHDLRDAVNDPNTPADVIASKLKAYRDARDKVFADWRAAQQELMGFLTVRQEAVIMSYGFIWDRTP